MRARCLTLAASFLLVAWSGALVLRGSAQQPVQDSRPFRSGVALISITATVIDGEGHLVKGLPREAFEIFEDGEKQTVAEFTNERVPVGLGLLLDVSDSMFGKRIKDARAAVDRFLFDLLDASDEFFV